MRQRRIDCPQAEAEGLFYGFPYDTQLVSANGVAFHVWLGSRADAEALTQWLAKKSRDFRDVVTFTYSSGEPTGFWAHSDYPN